MSDRVIQSGVPYFGSSHSVASNDADIRIVEVLLVALALALAAASLSFAMGRDLNWDFFNYHGYAAFDPLGERLQQDFFPAGYQGYLSRLGYLPLSWMNSAGWSSIAIGSALASLQSLNALFLYLVCREFTGALPRPKIVAFALTILGVATGAFLQQVGSTFVDPLTTPPIMAAVWLMLRKESNLKSFVLAGALAGIAVSMKLTNAPFALALIACGVMGHHNSRTRLAAFLAISAGLAIGVIVLYGSWGWKLYGLYGSPIFPLFNHIFEAPDFPSQPIIYNRFIPLSILDALWLPFAMAEHRSYVFNEGVVPDLRPAALALLSLVIAVRAIWRRVSAQAFESVPVSAASESPAQMRLSTFFVSALCAWLITSANGRYATPLLLLLSPLIFVTAASLFGRRSAGVLCLLLLAGQTLLVHDAGNPRWAPHDWSSRWLLVNVPESLKSQPYLYLSTSTTSESYLASYVHSDSVFVNPIGLLSIPSNGPGWSKFTKLRDRFAGQTKIIFPLPSELLPSNAEQSRILTMNGAIDRLGLTLSSTNCQKVVVNPSFGDVPFLWNRDKITRIEPRRVAVCDAQLREPSASMALARSQAAVILDAFERKCPKIFAPSHTETEGSGRLWSRLYGKFDLFAMIDLTTKDISYRLERQATDVVIGNVDTWRQDLEKFRCRLPHDGRRDISTLDGDAGR